jgi:PAS domain S-box-containing protein
MMARASNAPGRPTALRRRAESRLRARRTPVQPLAEPDLRRIVHELEVHQVEFEMQNEQLQTTQAELAATRDRYERLFSLAPTAYLVLDRTGNVLDANEAACRLLRRPRHLLRSRSLMILIRPDDRAAAARHLVEASASAERTCQVQVTLEGAPLRIVRLETVTEAISGDGREQRRTAMIDVTDHVQGERRLRAERLALERSQAALRELTRRLMLVEEAERRRIAADLHDDIGQRLHSVQMELSLLGRRPSGRTGSPRPLKALRRQLEQVIVDLDGLVRNLHPKIVDDLGLRVALQAHVEELGRRTGITARLRDRDLPRDIPPDLATCLYRVAQEALRNVHRHAGTAAARVTLARVRRGVGLCVADSGRGFDPNQLRHSGRGLGLVTMSERVGALGGRFRVRANPGDGTHVHAWVPLP